MFLSVPYPNPAMMWKGVLSLIAGILVALVQNWISPVFKYFPLKKYKHREGTQLYKNTLQRLEI